MLSEDLGGVEDERRHGKWGKSLKLDGSYDNDEESVVHRVNLDSRSH